LIFLLTAFEEGQIMKRTITVLSGMALFGSSVMAWALHPEPMVAKKFTTSLMTAYAQCTAPDDMYAGVWPACLQPAAPACHFGADGVGKVTAKVVLGSTHDIKLVAKLRGLTNCDGRTLEGAVNVRVTLDGCGPSEDPCTLTDQVIPVGTCVVDQGSCNVSASINQSLLDFLPTGKRTAIEILGCHVNDVTGDPPVRTFSCGLLVP
jgi:hypothetical protein